jgi:uncharacterized protein (DUF58 family)
MLIGTDAARPASFEELIGPALAARIDRLDVFSRKLLAGKMPGERRSKRRGRSVEFDDFRPYTPGDDPRHLDWNIFARLDRLVVKLFREDEDLALHLVIDASPSMDSGSPSKRVFATKLAMALGYIALVNQNRLSVALFGGADAPTGVKQLAPLRGKTSVRTLGAFLLDSLKPGVVSADRPAPRSADPAQFEEMMRRVASSRPGRGIMLVLSDFLVAWPEGARSTQTTGGPPGPARALNLIAGGDGGAFDAYALQILSPAELDPSREASLRGDLRLTDVETSLAAEVTLTPETLAEYRGVIDRHNRRLRDECLARGIAYFQARSDTPIEDLVLGSLRKGGLLR